MKIIPLFTFNNLLRAGPVKIKTTFIGSCLLKKHQAVFFHTVRSSVSVCLLFILSGGIVKS